MFVGGKKHIWKNTTLMFGIFFRYSLSALLDYTIFYCFKLYVDSISVSSLWWFHALILKHKANHIWLLFFLSENQRKNGIRIWKTAVIALLCSYFLSTPVSNCIQVWIGLSFCFGATSSKKNKVHKYLKEHSFLCLLNVCSDSIEQQRSQVAHSKRKHYLPVQFWGRCCQRWQVEGETRNSKPGNVDSSH